MIIPDYQKISKGVYCAKEMRTIADCTTDQVVLLGYFKHPQIEEVGTAFGKAVVRLEKNGAVNEQEEMLLSLPDDFREGLKTGSDLVKKIIAEELSPYSKDTYLRIQYGFIPRDYVEQCAGNFYQLNKFMDEMKLSTHGYGEEWCLDLRLRERRLLPYRDIDTLLKHGVEISNSVIMLWAKNKPDPGRIHTKSKRAFVKRLYQSKFSLKRLPNTTDPLLQNLTQDVLYALNEEAMLREEEEGPEDQDGSDAPSDDKEPGN